MDLFISAGEASSDIHCAHLLAELKKSLPSGGGKVRAWGLGGDRLAAEGVELVMHNREFSVGGGPIEVIAKIPLRGRLERLIEKALFARKPVDVALLADNGEINLRLASLFNFFGVPVVYFIPPKVWVWRHSRIEDLENHVDLVLSILPFEEPIYRHWEIPFEYVGNPLIDEVDLTLSPETAKERLGIPPDRSVLTVMAGSRYNEVRYHSELFGTGIRRFVEQLTQGRPRPLILLPAAQAIDPEDLRAMFSKGVEGLDGVEVRAVKGQSHECLRASRAALVKSGTSTLEAALLGVPMVLAYHSSKSSEWVFRHIVRYRGFVGLVNLFLAADAEDALGWGKPIQPVVPELILENCTTERIALELGRIWEDGEPRSTQLRELARMLRLLAPPDSGSTKAGGASPIKRAAQAVLSVYAKTRKAGEKDRV